MSLFSAESLKQPWLRNTVEALATGFYFGKARWAPGTWGTLWGIPLAWGLAKGGDLFYMFASVLCLVFAVAVAEMHEIVLQSHDAKEIVIDEVVGYVIAMTMLPATWQAYLGAFLAFRFFDILKPFPIRQIDQRVKGGLGTVLDDVAAGIAANFCLQIIYARTDLLGVQLGFT